MRQINRISPYPVGHFKELLCIALPLIMAALSENIMVFFDRIILSHYSLNALNSTTLASQTVEIFQYGIWATAGMTELFVARLNAKGIKREMAVPCWQMIYFSLICLPFIAIISLTTGSWVLPVAYHSTGLSFYRIFMFTVPLMGMISALSGFFVGQGKFKCIIWATVIANLINLALDFILIFGIPKLTPGLGPKGAAIAAIISLSIQVIWLFCIFINKDNRKNFHTGSYKFNKYYFKKSIKIGFPISLSHIGEMLGWVVIMKLVADTGVKNFTILSIGNTIYLIYAFVNDSLFRSLSTIISHHLSAGHTKAIVKSLKSGAYLLVIYLAILAVPLLIAPHLLIKLFNLNHHLHQWHHTIKISLIFVWLYFLMTGVFWIISSALTARQRTNSIMVINLVSMWLITILTLAITIEFFGLSSLMIWPIICLYALGSCIAISYYYYLRL